MDTKMRNELFASRDLLAALRIHIPPEFHDSVDGRIRDIEAYIREASAEGCTHLDSEKTFPDERCPICGPHPASPPKERRDDDVYCLCGHNFHWHFRETGDCNYDGCNCHAYRPAPAQGEVLREALLSRQSALSALRTAREALENEKENKCGDCDYSFCSENSDKKADGYIVGDRTTCSQVRNICAALSEIDRVLGGEG